MTPGHKVLEAVRVQVSSGPFLLFLLIPLPVVGPPFLHITNIHLTHAFPNSHLPDRIVGPFCTAKCISARQLRSSRYS